MGARRDGSERLALASAIVAVACALMGPLMDRLDPHANVRWLGWVAVLLTFVGTSAFGLAALALGLPWLWWPARGTPERRRAVAAVVLGALAMLAVGLQVALFLWALSTLD
jgi:hypothetical protein